MLEKRKKSDATPAHDTWRDSFCNTSSAGPSVSSLHMGCFVAVWASPNKIPIQAIAARLGFGEVWVFSNFRPLIFFNRGRN